MDQDRIKEIGREIARLSARRAELERKLALLKSPKRREQVISNIEMSRTEGKLVALFATASLLGEGFNLPELDPLLLAPPISFEGRLVQYDGRLQRAATGKSDVGVFDYADSSVPVLLKMYRGRVRTYQKLGYEIADPKTPVDDNQLRLY